MIGSILGLARRPVSRAPMETVKHALLTTDVGFFGDCKGAKFPDRQVTILAAEDWNAALLDLAGPAGPPDLQWTARRANMFVEGLRLPRGLGSILQVRDCLLKVTAETYPCEQMERAHPGLMSALARGWRGGVTCKVLTGGSIAIGDPIKILVEQPEWAIRLPA
jgi:MOSC domain-containing protein YiiM